MVYGLGFCLEEAATLIFLQFWRFPRYLENAPRRNVKICYKDFWGACGVLTRSQKKPSRMTPALAKKSSRARSQDHERGNASFQNWIEIDTFFFARWFFLARSSDDVDNNKKSEMKNWRNRCVRTCSTMFNCHLFNHKINYNYHPPRPGHPGPR